MDDLPPAVDNEKNENNEDNAHSNTDAEDDETCKESEEWQLRSKKKKYFQAPFFGASDCHR